MDMLAGKEYIEFVVTCFMKYLSYFHVKLQLLDGEYDLYYKLIDNVE